MIETKSATSEQAMEAGANAMQRQAVGQRRGRKRTVVANGWGWRISRFVLAFVFPFTFLARVR